MIQKLYSAYGITCGVLLLLILFPFVLIGSLWPAPKGSRLIGKACHIYASVWLFMVGIKYQEIKKSGDDGSDPFIYIANHRSYIDVMLMFKAIRMPFRPLGKQEMVRYPIFGFFYRKLVICVNRENFGSRARSFAALKENIQQGIGVFIFPEGTFNESQRTLNRFQDGAFQLAMKTGAKIQPVVFIDNLARMHYSSFFKLSPGKCRVVFLDPVDPNAYADKDVALLKQDIFDSMVKTIIHYQSSADRTAAISRSPHLHK